MRLPHRSVKSIQPLPSIYTAFPVNHNNTRSSYSSGIDSGTCFIRQIEDGIEVVPFERSETLSAPILSPDQTEKEVFAVSQKEMDLFEKPLPNLPGSIWQRMSLRRRMLALLGAQIALLLTIGLALLAAKNDSSASDQPSVLRAAGDEPFNGDTVAPIRRGSFAVPIQLPQQQSSACLARTNESVAWQCAFDTDFQLNILPSSPIEPNETMVTLGAPPNNDSIYQGHQVPELRPVELTTIYGLEDGSLAYYFRTTYNHTVLLREEDLTLAELQTSQPLTQHPTFQPGEILWRCVFNETLIEGHIFVKQPTTPEVTSNGTTTGNTTTTVYLPKIPYVVKLVEQRAPNGKGPYCEKMEAQQDGSMAPRPDKIMLNLSNPASELEASKSKLSSSAQVEAMQPTQTADYCRCQWLIQ